MNDREKANRKAAEQEARILARHRLEFRIASFIAGAVILFHEVWLTRESEPVLDLIALWMMGLPVADLATVLTTNLLGATSAAKASATPDQDGTDSSSLPTPRKPKL